jgi:capsular polysaccharide biosynthesis protein
MALGTAEHADSGRELHWIRSGSEGAATPLLATLRAGTWFIVLTLLLSLGGVALYLSRADDVYESSVDLLVTPAGDDAGIPGVTLLRGSNDPTRNVETAARLVTAPDVIRRAVRDLRLDRSVESVRNSVSASPVAESDIVTVTAQASSPEEARALADAVSRSSVRQRTEALHAQLDDVIPRVRSRIEETADPATKEMLTARLADLQTLHEMPDPTIRVATAAELPRSSVSPRRRLSVVIAIIAGLLAGIGGVIAFQLIDPRILSEDQLRERYRLPILAAGRRRRWFRGDHGHAAEDEFRTLRSALLARDGHADRLGGTCVMLLAPSRADARMSAMRLGRSLTIGGASVLVVGTDGRPATVDTEMSDLLLDSSSVLREAAVTPAGEPEGLYVLFDSPTQGALSDVLDGPTAEWLVAEADAAAEWLVAAAPGYERTADMLPLARRAGFVVLLIRYSATRVGELRRLADMLSDQGIEPAGFVILSEAGPRAYLRRQISTLRARLRA